MNQKNDNSYSADNIKVLEGLTAVRKRPAMYIGSTSSLGLHHLVYEVVDNSIDESLAGFCDDVKITINVDGSVTVEDNGRGIPVDWHATENKPAAEVVMTVLHAGGKFDSDTYKVSGGLHGVGVSVVNALSSRLELEIRRNGKIYQQVYEKGVPVSDLKENGDTIKKGTKITFWPDSSIFETVEFSYEILSKRLRELAFLNAGVRIIITDNRNDKKHEFYYEGGISSFVEYLNRAKSAIHPNVIFFEGEKEGVQIEIAFQYNDGYDEKLFTFANNINTYEGGTHLIGFKAALTRTMNTYAAANNLMKNIKATVSGDDLREGMAAVISVKVPDPQFEGQTKTKLGNSEIKGYVETLLNEKLATYLEENPQVSKKILEKGIEAASRSNQAILPLKGKILNVEKARFDKMLTSNEIRTLITAMGAGIGKEDFDVAKLRYHRIIIMTDADVDGSHIRTLLLTFFFRQMPELIERGYLYIAQPPLYKLKRGKKEIYLKDEDVLLDYLLNIGVENCAIELNDGEKIIRGKQIIPTLKNIIEYNELFEKLVRKGIKKELLDIFVKGKIQNGFGDLVDLTPLVEKLQHVAPHADFTLYQNPARILFTMGNTRARIDQTSLDILSSHEYKLLLQAYRQVSSICNDEIIRINEENKETVDVENRQELLSFFLNKAKKGQYIQRYKGLGEMNPDQLWETTMDPEKRVLLQVKIEDAVSADEVFTILMGDQVEPRREFIENNALNVSNLDI